MLPSPYHALPADSWIFWGGVLLGLLGIAFHAVRERSGAAFQVEERAAEERNRWRYVFWFVAAGWLVVHAHFVSHAWMLIGGDEYSRVGFSFAWARDPFFVTHDMIWLAGHFYALGSLYYLFGDMHLVVQATGIIGVLATMYWTGGLAIRLWGRIEAGVFAAVVVGVHWIMLWASVNPLADVFLFPALMLCFDRLAAFWFEENRPRSTMPLLIAGAAVGFGNMFRFESWYLGILLGVLLIGVTLVLLLKKAGWKLWLPPLVGAALDALYPLAHLLMSWRKYGSPTAFLSKASEMNEAGNLFYQTETAWQRFISYPSVGWNDHFYLISAIVAGIILAFMPAFRRRGIFVFAACGSLMLFSMLISIKSGIGSNNRPRYTMFLLLPLVAFLPGTLLALWTWGFPLLRWLPRLLVIGLLALIVITSTKRSLKWYTNGYEWMGEDVAFVAQLEREQDTQGRQSQGGFIHPKGVTLAVFTWNDFNFYEVARYHSRFPEDVSWSGDEHHFADLVSSHDPRFHFAIRGPMPEHLSMEETHEQVLDNGLWQVWRLQQ